MSLWSTLATTGFCATTTMLGIVAGCDRRAADVPLNYY